MKPEHYAEYLSGKCRCSICGQVDDLVVYQLIERPLASCR
jgi:hypothetical protein